jgi:hypothetical protein
VPQDDYQQIYKAVQPTMDGVFSEPAGADPRDIKGIYDQAQRRGERASEGAV